MSAIELLEMAAKAAEIDISAGWSMRLNAFCVEPGPETGAYVGWNPRADDGDAFRLQVGLNMHTAIQFDGDTADAWVYDDDGPLHFCSEPFSAHAGDKCEAMRMAILRCAAEIGKDKP